MPSHSKLSKHASVAGQISARIQRERKLKVILKKESPRKRPKLSPKKRAQNSLEVLDGNHWKFFGSEGNTFVY